MSIIKHLKETTTQLFNSSTILGEAMVLHQGQRDGTIELTNYVSEKNCDLIGNKRQVRANIKRK